MDFSEALARIEARLDAEANLRQQERRLDSLTAPSLNMGIFALGMALPMLGQGFSMFVASPTALHGLAPLFMAAVFVALGARLALAATAVQSHFSKNNSLLPEFLVLMDETPTRADKIRDWLSRPDIADHDFAKALHRVVQVLKFGWWGLILLACYGAFGLAVTAWTSSYVSGGWKLSLGFTLLWAFLMGLVLGATKLARKPDRKPGAENGFASEPPSLSNFAPAKGAPLSVDLEQDGHPLGSKTHPEP